MIASAIASAADVAGRGGWSSRSTRAGTAWAAAARLAPSVAAGMTVPVASASSAATTVGPPLPRAAASSAAISARRATSAAPRVNSGTPGNAAASPLVAMVSR